MPAAPTQSRRRAARRSGIRPVLAGAIAVVVGIAVFVGVGFWASSGDVQVRLGDDVFDVGPSKALAVRIRDDRTPLLFQDLLIGGSRDIWVNHISATEDTGWVAFEARPAGADRRCNVQWDKNAQHFVDPCTGAAVAPDGGALTHFPVQITENHHVTVDLSPGGLPGQGPSTLAATSTIRITGTTLPRVTTASPPTTSAP